MAKDSGFYEIDLLEYMLNLRAFSSPGQSVAVDVGANIGNHAVFFGSFLTDRVIAVEPNPAVHPLLQQNLDANVANAVACRVALGESPGYGQITMPHGALDNIGMARVARALDPAAANVEIVTLDSLWAGMRRDLAPSARVALLKVDVEGMEIMVLRGATELLTEHRPHVFVEAATATRFRELREFLSKLGYEPVSRWAATPVYHFLHSPSRSIRWRAGRLKLLSECRRPVEVRRMARKLLASIRNLY